MLWRSSWAGLLPGKRSAPSEALYVHLEYRCVVNQAIDRSESHCRILEDLTPFAERLIRSDQKRSTFVSRADQLEQHGGLRLIFGHVDKIVQDQQVVADVVKVVVA